MIASTYLMFKHRNEWPLVMIIGALFMLYAVIAIPKELDKENNSH
jgi:starvation-inducible outer membrane lipoprotein